MTKVVHMVNDYDTRIFQIGSKASEGDACTLLHFYDNS